MRTRVQAAALACSHLQVWCAVPSPEAAAPSAVSVLMDKATKLKQDGNELFKEELYADALIRYKVRPRIRNSE